MTVSLDLLVAELRAYAPTGVELPRDDDNQTRISTIHRWAKEAARKINERREVTTVLETEVTLAAGQDEYALPSGAREILRISRQHTASTAEDFLGVPAEPMLGYSPFGQIPTGQELDAGLDMVNRLNLARSTREDDYDIIGGKLRLLFPINDGEVIVVSYRAIDDEVEALPDENFDRVLLFLRYKLLDWYVGVHGVSIAQDGSAFGVESIASFQRARDQLLRQWTAELNSVAQEVA